MNTITIESTRRFPSRTRPLSGAPRAIVWRTALVVTVLVACGVAAAFGEPSMLALSDPALARLLRGMALLKAAMTITAIGLLWWRLGRAIRPEVAIAAGLAIAAMAAATVSIWRLAFLLPAAFVFHAGLFTLLVLAARAGVGALAMRPRRLRADGASSAHHRHP